MSLQRDSYGKARIPLGPPLNAEGYLEIDGDLLEEGPVVILRLQMESDRSDCDPVSGLEYGSFQVETRGGALLSAGLMLDERAGRDLIEQLSWQLRPAAAWETQKGNKAETLADFTDTLDGILLAAVDTASEAEILQWMIKRLRLACENYLEFESGQILGDPREDES